MTGLSVALGACPEEQDPNAPASICRVVSYIEQKRLGFECETRSGSTLVALCETLATPLWQVFRPEKRDSDAIIWLSCQNVFFLGSMKRAVVNGATIKRRQGLLKSLLVLNQNPRTLIVHTD